MKRPRAPNHINRRFIGGRRRRVWNGAGNDGRMRQGDHFDLHLGQRALESGVHHIAGLKVFLTGRPVAHANHHPAIEKVMDTHLRGGRGGVTPTLGDRVSGNRDGVIPLRLKANTKISFYKAIDVGINDDFTDGLLVGHGDAFAVVTRRDGRGQGHHFSTTPLAPRMVTMFPTTNGRVSMIETPRRNLTGTPELQTLRQRLLRPPARSTARW